MSGLRIRNIGNFLSLWICLILQVTATTAQTQTFQLNNQLSDSSAHHLSLRFESTSFLKNNEYDSPFTRGFTGIGVFAKPTLEYYFTENTRVNAGVFLLKYSGINAISETIPIFSVQQELHENLDLVIGSLYGTLNHGIREPMFRFDRNYQDNLEYGLQLLYNNGRHQSDLWINWDQFIFPGDDLQEEFEVGWVSSLRPIESESFAINLPVQFLLYHIGGEIDVNPNPAYSILNVMTGLEFEFRGDNGRSFSVEPSYYIYKGLDIPFPIGNGPKGESGNGFYLNANYESRKFEASMGYWSSDSFFAPRGEYLFVSQSEFDNFFFEPLRSIVTAKVGYHHDFADGIRLVLRGDGYYDTDRAQLSHALGIYFLIDESFFISKLKNNEE